MGLFRQPSGDITSGVIWKQLLAFFFPLWLGTFFQQLYNTVDTLVVGRLVGKTALAAVGSTAVVVNLTVGLFTGLASGAVVVIAQHFGARRGEEVHKAVHTSMLLSILIGAVFTVAGFLLTPWALEALGTTEDVMGEATLYLRIYFLGMVPNLIYNMGTSVLRAIGDSRRPLLFLIAASLCNIVLDLAFVALFHWDVAGVAIATVASQVLSAVLVLLSLTRAQGDPYQFFPRKMYIYGDTLLATLRIGVPAALQSLMYSISNLVIQAAINSFGTDTMAAWAAYSKVDVLFWMTLNAMSLALTTFAGQNYGAGESGRLKKSVWISSGMIAVFTVAISFLLTFFSRPVLSIFVREEETAVLALGEEMIRFLVPFYITYILVELLPGAIRGAGKSMVPMVISLFGICVIRLVWLFAVVPSHHTVQVVMASYPITWIVTTVAMLAYYFWGRWLTPQAQLQAQPGK